MPGLRRHVYGGRNGCKGSAFTSHGEGSCVGTIPHLLFEARTFAAPPSGDPLWFGECLFLFPLCRCPLRPESEMNIWNLWSADVTSLNSLHRLNGGIQQLAYSGTKTKLPFFARQTDRRGVKVLSGQTRRRLRRGRVHPPLRSSQYHRCHRRLWTRLPARS